MKIIILALALILTSCGAIDRFFTSMTGEFTYKCSKSGVEYVQSDSGITVHINTDGSPVKCEL